MVDWKEMKYLLAVLGLILTVIVLSAVRLWLGGAPDRRQTAMVESFAPVPAFPATKVPSQPNPFAKN